MIKEFDLGVFRRKFWVAINPEFEEMKEKLLYLSSRDEYIELLSYTYDDMKVDDGGLFRVITKEDGEKGYLLFIEDKPDDIVDLVDTISHESGHLSDRLIEDISEEKVGTETNSHIIGYVAGKVMETILEYRKQKEETA